MLLFKIHKHNFLLALNVHFPNRLFNISHNNYVRKLVFKSSEAKIKHKNLEKPLGSLMIEQNNNANFLGIEGDKGVIFVHALENYAEAEPSKPSCVSVKQKLYRATFGVIRYDSVNKPNVHGQFENIDNLFPHKSTDFSDVSGRNLKVNTDIFSVLYTKSSSDDKLANSEYKLESNHNEYSSSEELSSDISNSEIIEFYNKTYQISRNEGMKETQDMSYVDECFFDGLNENNSNKICVEELNYLDANIFNENMHIKNRFSGEPKLDQNSTENVKFLSKNQNLNVFLEGENSTRYLHKDTITKYPSKKNSFFKETVVAVSKSVNSTTIENEINNVHRINTKNFHGESKLKYQNSKPEYSPGTNLSAIANTFQYQLDSDVTDQLKAAQNISIQSVEKNLEMNSNTEYNGNIDLEKAFVVPEMQPSKNVINNELSDSSHIATAYEFVEKLREECKLEKKVDVTAKTEEKVDSKGFRILKNQVPNLSQHTRDEILTLLKENILYSDDDLLILNKPYGLVLHDSKTIQYPCLSLFLNDLAKDFDHKVADPQLHTVHRLDKDTTGCLLLARNNCMEQNLKSLFAQRKIIKKYWILTSQVPDPLEGVIDIPISEGSVDGKKRMVLHPQIVKDIPYKNHSKIGKRAVTSYKVICTSGNAALVEVIPETGIKHQIRVHFGFGLSCPILGDHKYSHLKKMAPQKLASDLLQKLHVRQSKVRHIPMHIHAKTIVIPGYLDGRDLYVTAPLPVHMKINMKRLKFKKKNKL